MSSVRHATSARTTNLQRVIGALRQRGQMTQAEIARHLDLAPATVSNLVHHLVDQGIVEASGTGGRRGLDVRIARSAGVVVGVDFGHSHVQVAVGDLAGRPLATRRRPLDHDHSHGEGMTLARVLLTEVLDTTGDSFRDVLAAGVGLPAPISADGRISAGSILPGWVGVDAADAASAALGLPTLVDNDANLGAVAEHREHPDVSTLAYLKVSSGVGCGLVLDGRPYRGGVATAGEVGHITLDETGPLCRCGSRGCLEAYAGGAGLVDQLSGRLPGVGVTDLVHLADSGDVGARRLLEDAGRALGQGSAMIANLLGPEMIVVGGDLACEIVLDGVRDGLRRHSVDGLSAHVTVAKSQLGEDASVIGALALALDAVSLPL